MANDDRFIDGIYNYCDRWCERCPLTFRCRGFANRDSRPAGDAGRDWDDSSQFVRSELHDALALLDKFTAEHGIEIPDEEVEREAEEHERLARAAHADPLVRGARAYSETVIRWRAARGRPMPAACGDARAIIEWHHTRIWIKLARALTSDATAAAFGELTGGRLQTDANGSAKVALLGIDASAAAWRAIAAAGPAESAAAGAVATDLDRLATRVEQRFPDARRFIRPGFDTLPPAPALALA
jgi:hypothetical protein